MIDGFSVFKKPWFFLSTAGTLHESKTSWNDGNDGKKRLLESLGSEASLDFSKHEKEIQWQLSERTFSGSHPKRCFFWKAFQKNMAGTVFNVDQDWPKRIMCSRTETRNQALSSSPRTPRGNYICCYIVARCLKKKLFPRSQLKGQKNAELASASPQPSCSSVHH